VSAVSARATRLVVLVPGKADRDRLVARLARAFGVPEEEVGRLLPPGGFGFQRVQGLELGLDAAV